MSELEGQLSLFTLDGCDEKTQAEYADEVCRNPECWCVDPAERAARRDSCRGEDCWCAPPS